MLGNEEAAKDMIPGTEKCCRICRTQLAKRINLRNTPEITFILDQSIGTVHDHMIDEVTENLRDSESNEKKMSKNILEGVTGRAEHRPLLWSHPSGRDCIGTTLGLLNYLRENYLQIEAELFLDHPAAKFSYMNDFEKIHTDCAGKQFDLCITLDASDKRASGQLRGLF